MVHLHHGARAPMVACFDAQSLVRRLGLCPADEANYPALLFLARLNRAALRSASGANAPRLGMAESGGDDRMDRRRRDSGGHVDVVLAELEDLDGVCHREYARASWCHMGERRQFWRRADLLARNLARQVHPAGPRPSDAGL